MDQIAAEEPARLVQQPEEPRQSGPAHPGRRPGQRLRGIRDRGATADEPGPGARRGQAGDEALLLGEPEPHVHDVRCGRGDPVPDVLDGPRILVESERRGVRTCDPEPGVAAAQLLARPAAGPRAPRRAGRSRDPAGPPPRSARRSASRRLPARAADGRAAGRPTPAASRRERPARRSRPGGAGTGPGGPDGRYRRWGWRPSHPRRGGWRHDVPDRLGLGEAIEIESGQAGAATDTGRPRLSTHRCRARRPARSST